MPNEDMWDKLMKWVEKRNEIAFERSSIFFPIKWVSRWLKLGFHGFNWSITKYVNTFLSYRIGVAWTQLTENSNTSPVKNPDIGKHGKTWSNCSLYIYWTPSLDPFWKIQSRICINTDTLFTHTLTLLLYLIGPMK